MALSAAVPTNLPISFSNGPWKQQVMNFSVANGDTSGTITVPNLSSIVFAQVSGLVLTAAPTFSSNVVTLAFVDPAATRHGQITVLGR